MVNSFTKQTLIFLVLRFVNQNINNKFFLLSFKVLHLIESSIKLCNLYHKETSLFSIDFFLFPSNEF